MDESHRLKPMVEGYDANLFHQIYKDTKDLRKKLAYNIDHRKFGVEREEVMSWFDVKFVYAFNKYYGDPRIKGHIIKSLQTLKLRIVKQSYAPKFELHQTVDITELYNYDELVIENLEVEPDSRLNTVKNYFKKRLSDDAYFLFEIDLNPPPYIIQAMKNPDKEKMSKIPAELIAEYLDIPFNDEFEMLIKSLRKDIESMKSQARDYFSIHQPT